MEKTFCVCGCLQSRVKDTPLVCEFAQEILRGGDPRKGHGSDRAKI